MPVLTIPAAVQTPAPMGSAKTPEVAPITLPPLGPLDISPPSRTDLPLIPPIPASRE
jgi:hypothetical protein